MSSLLRAAEEHNIKAAAINGIGAVKDACISIMDFPAGSFVDKEFREPMELTGLSGNLCLVEGKPYAHLHVTLADSKYRVIGGHLKRAHISVTGEFVFFCIDAQISRKFNPDIHTMELMM